MQKGSRQINQEISLATNSFTYGNCGTLSNILSKRFNLKCTVVKTGRAKQREISIWKQAMPIFFLTKQKLLDLLIFKK